MLLCQTTPRTSFGCYSVKPLRGQASGATLSNHSADKLRVLLCQTTPRTSFGCYSVKPLRGQASGATLSNHSADKLRVLLCQTTPRTSFGCYSVKPLRGQASGATLSNRQLLIQQLIPGQVGRYSFGTSLPQLLLSQVSSY